MPQEKPAFKYTGMSVEAGAIFRKCWIEKNVVDR